MNFTNNNNNKLLVKGVTGQFMTSWTHDGNVYVPSPGDYGNQVIHNPHSLHFPECIWVVGGVYHSTKIYCYNLTSNTYSQYDTLSLSAYNQVQQSVVLYTTNETDYIFYARYDGHLYKYDIVYSVSFNLPNLCCN